MNGLSKDISYRVLPTHANIVFLKYKRRRASENIHILDNLIKFTHVKFRFGNRFVSQTATDMHFKLDLYYLNNLQMYTLKKESFLKPVFFISFVTLRHSDCMYNVGLQL